MVSRVLLLAAGGWMDVPIAETLRRHGREVKQIDQRTLPLHPDPSLAEGCDAVLCHGPNRGSMLPAAEIVSRLPPGPDRPLFVWWVAENLPDPRLPGWLVDQAARLRVEIGRWLDAAHASSPRRPQAHPRAHRLRVLGELLRIRALGALDVLPVAGAGRTEYLRRRGFDAFPVFIGCHRVLGHDLGLERDLDVVFVGQAGTRRRRALLQRLETELEARGIGLRIYDGVRASLYGEERTQVLNRCKIYLNILKAPHDAVAYRLLLGAANKALIVSEPLFECTGFEPGRHLVTCPIDMLADTIELYLRREEDRRSICEAAYELVTRELTMERSVGRILQRCDERRGAQRSAPAA